MNSSMKQKQIHRYREHTCGCQGGGGWEGWTGSFGLTDIQVQFLKIEPIYKIGKQQGPTVQHRELYSVSCNKP